MTFKQVKANAVKKGKAKQAKQAKIKKPPVVVRAIQPGPGVVTVNGINVDRNTNMPTWVQGGVKYHINMRSGDDDHVTREEPPPETHYFFKGSGDQIKGVRPSPKAQGKGRKWDPDTEQYAQTKKSFDELPDDVQSFIREYFSQIFP